MKKLYTIYHVYDVYNGIAGGPLQQLKNLGMVEATEKEMEEFLKEWNKPRVYYNMYDKLYEHKIIATETPIKELKDIVPYDPTTREWPDIPYGKDFGAKWDPESKQWCDL